MTADNKKWVCTDNNKFKGGLVMKGKVIKLISLLCVGVLIASSLAACSSNQKKQEANKVTGEKVLEPIVYNIVKNVTVPGWPEDGGIGKKLIIEKLEQAGIKNVNYKLTVISGVSEYKTKINLMVASGETPDLFTIPDVETGNRFAEEEVIMAVDDLLKIAPNYTKVVRTSDMDALKYKGKLYVLPSGYRPEPFNSPNVNGYMGRGDWLTNVGLSMPDTLEEFHNAMLAFTNNDPDKNGKKDTYGIGGSKNDLVPPGLFPGIFGAYGVIPSFWYERDGKLKQGYILPETKEALKTLQDWYKEGIIDPDFLLIDNNKRTEKIVNSKIGIFSGQFSTADIYNGTHASLRKIVPTASLVMYPAPKGPKGLRGWPDVKSGSSETAGISAKTKDAERLMKIVDWVTTDEGARMTQFGREGTEYVYNKEKNVIERKIENESDMYALGFGTAVRFVPIVDRRWMTELGLRAVETASKYILPNKFGGTVPAMTDFPELQKICDEYMIKIITGTLPISAWDEFMVKYYNGGGKVVEEQVNAQWLKTKK